MNRINCAVAPIKIWNCSSGILSGVVPIRSVWHTALYHEQSCSFAAGIPWHGSWEVGSTWQARGWWIVSSQLNSVYCLKHQCLPRPKVSVSLFSILCLRCHFFVLGGSCFCQRQGVLCRGAVGREQVLPAPAASVAALCPPQLPVLRSPALQQQQQCWGAAVHSSFSSGCWGGTSPGLGTVVPVHPFFWREEWLGLAFISSSTLVML